MNQKGEEMHQLLLGWWYMVVPISSNLEFHDFMIFHVRNFQND